MSQEWQLTTVILATQEAEIRRIAAWSQPGQIVWANLSWKNPSQKRAGGVAQGVGPEFKFQNHKKKNQHASASIKWDVKEIMKVWTSTSLLTNLCVLGNAAFSVKVCYFINM
jgi:hypothetical protein